MARRKYEFKPDRTGAGLLSKLYITQTQRQTLLKWALYSLVCLIMLIVQDTLMSGIHFFGATTDLFCAAVLLVCLLEGAESGGLFCLWAGLFYWFSGSAPGLYSIVLLPLLGIFASVFRQAYLHKGLLSATLCAGVSLMVYEMTVFAIGALLGQTLLQRYDIFLLTGLYSVLLLPVLYPIVHAIGRIGGESWKE